MGTITKPDATKAVRHSDNILLDAATKASKESFFKHPIEKTHGIAVSKAMQAKVAAEDKGIIDPMMFVGEGIKKKKIKDPFKKLRRMMIA